MPMLFGQSKVGIIRAVAVTLFVVSFCSHQSLISVIAYGMLNSLMIGVTTFGSLNEMVICVLLLSLTTIVVLSSASIEVT